MPKLCIMCHERKATVPDRERMGRPINRVCSQCHAERLRGDFERILAQKPFCYDCHGEGCSRCHTWGVTYVAS